MPQPQPPGVNDLQQLFRGTGLIDPSAAPYSAINWTSKAAAAVEKCHQRTGRVFGVTAPATRLFDPPRSTSTKIALHTDLCRIDALSISGTAKTLNQDYFAGPENADADGLPFSYVELVTSYPFYPAQYFAGTPRKCVSITGVWAYSMTVPDDIWEAELMYAGALTAPAIELSLTGGLLSIEENGLRVVYSGAGSPSPLFNQAKLWLSQAMQTFADKKRVI